MMEFFSSFYNERGMVVIWIEMFMIVIIKGKCLRKICGEFFKEEFVCLFVF